MHWLDAQQAKYIVEPQKHAWLFNPNSLTSELLALSSNKLEVKLIKQNRSCLRPDESLMLNSQIKQYGWEREIYLVGENKPWVFARSVASEQTFKYFENTLMQLNSNFLGHWLKQFQFKRSPLKCRQYADDFLPKEIQQINLWSRRSCFTYKSFNIMVTEVFLDDFWQALKRV